MIERIAARLRAIAERRARVIQTIADDLAREEIPPGTRADDVRVRGFSLLLKVRIR